MSLDQATLRALPNFPETLAEANPHLPSLDTDELARSRSYAAADAREVLAKFRRARAQTLDLLAGAADARIGVPMTMKQSSRSIVLLLAVAGCTPAVTEGQPAFVRQLIADIEAAPAANSPGGIWKYQYGGRTVYYLPPSCCDVPSVLFDAEGAVLCGPDGGFTGRGDGRCPDFFDHRSDGQLVWDDPRVE